MTLFRGLFCQVAQEVVRALKKEAGSWTASTIFLRNGDESLENPETEYVILLMVQKYGDHQFIW